MKKVLKNLVLGILIICTVITVVPIINTQAAIKPYTKEKQLWVDIDKITPEKYIKMVHKYGKKGIKEKTHYFLGFKMNTKTKKETIAKLNKFQRKVMKAKNNKYSISMGAGMDNANSDTWEKGNKISMYTSCNDVVYMEQIIGDALKQRTYSVMGYDRKGRYVTATVYVKDLFPTINDFKKASDSVKLQFMADYMGKHCMFYAGTPKNGYDSFCFEGVASEGKCYGVCSDFAIMYAECTRMLCNTGIFMDSKLGDISYCGADVGTFYSFNHSVAACYARNSYGTNDVFEGNNAIFRTFSYPEKLQPKSGTTGKNISMIYMYYHAGDYDLLFNLDWIVNSKTKKDIKRLNNGNTYNDGKKYYNSKHNSELFNICYDIAINY